MAATESAEGTIDFKLAREIIEKYKDEKEAVIGLLQDVQAQYGYLPRPVLDLIAKELELPATQLYGLATFYRAFSLAPEGKHHVSVCTGTACHVRGAQSILDRIQAELGIRPGETTEDGLFTLHTVNCVGACALGPVVIVDGEYEGHMTSAKIVKVLQRYGMKKKIKENIDASEPK